REQHRQWHFTTHGRFSNQKTLGPSRGRTPFRWLHVVSKLHRVVAGLAVRSASSIMPSYSRGAIRGSPASMGMADSSRRIRIGDIDLAYPITGRGNPVIPIHGPACGQRMWFHQRRKLSDRHAVVTYDQRGHGLSDAPDDAGRYSGAHLSRDLAGIVDALNLDKVAIVGFSMGGGPALA